MGEWGFEVFRWSLFFNAYLLIVWGGGGLYFVVLFVERCVFYFAF